MDGPEIRVTSTMFDTKHGGTLKRIFLFEQVIFSDKVQQAYQVLYLFAYIYTLALK